MKKNLKKMRQVLFANKWVLMMVKSKLMVQKIVLLMENNCVQMMIYG